jgi:hypothetical protein
MEGSIWEEIKRRACRRLWRSTRDVALQKFGPSDIRDTFSFLTFNAQADHHGRVRSD